MSHFYAFDRKQSLLLLFAGVLLAVLVLMLGWIIGLLMRPAPETAPPSAAETDERRTSGAAAPASTKAAPPETDPDSREAAVSQGAVAARAEALSAAGDGARKAGGAAESVPASVPGTSSSSSESPSGASAGAERASAPSASGPADSADGAEPDPSSASPAPAAAITARPSAPAESPAEETAPDWGPHHRYVVVVDTFAVASKAEARAAELKGDGYAPRLRATPAERTAGRMGLHSVILGDYPRPETAEAAAERFREREGGTPTVRSVPAADREPDASGAADSDDGAPDPTDAAQ